MGGTCLHSSHGGITGRSPPVFTSWLRARWHECVLRVYKILRCPFRRRSVNEVCFFGSFGVRFTVQGSDTLPYPANMYGNEDSPARPQRNLFVTVI